MAVALPDVLPPELAKIEEIRTQASESGTLRFQKYTIHMLGPKLIDEAALNAAASGAESLSDVVRNISAELFQAGYPAAQVRYALQGDELYILAHPGEVAAVEGNERIAPYFDGLEGRSPLMDSDLEPARSLASIHADRAGLEIKPAFVPEAGQSGKARMQLEQNGTQPDPTDIRVEFGNPGNRFVGRHFLKLDVRHGFASGDEVSVTWNEGLSGLNQADDAEDYHQQKLVWNRVSPYGIFGLSGNNTDYTINAGGTEINGDLQVAELAWLYPLRASFRGR